MARALPGPALGGEETFARAMSVARGGAAAPAPRWRGSGRRRRARRRLAMGVLWRRSEAARTRRRGRPPRRGAAVSPWASSSWRRNRPPARLCPGEPGAERRPDVRRFVVRALSQGPTPVIVVRTGTGWGGTELSFSRTGEWLSSLNVRTGAVRLWRQDGSPRQIPESGSPRDYASGGFADDAQRVRADRVGFDSGSTRCPRSPRSTASPGSFRWGFVRGASLVTGDLAPALPDGRPRRLIRAYPVPDGAPATTLGMLIVSARPPRQLRGRSHRRLDAEPVRRVALRDLSVDTSTSRRASSSRLRRSDYVLPIGARRLTNLPAPQIDAARGRVTRHLRCTRLVGLSHRSKRRKEGKRSALMGGGWPLASRTTRYTSTISKAPAGSGSDASVRLASRPLSVAIHPNGSWMAVQDSRTISLWPMEWRHARVLRHCTKRAGGPGRRPCRPVACLGRNLMRPSTCGPCRSTRQTVRTTLDFAENANHKTASAANRPDVAKITASPRGHLIAAGTFSGLWLLPLYRQPRASPGIQQHCASRRLRSVRAMACGRRRNLRGS